MVLKPQSCVHTSLRSVCTRDLGQESPIPIYSSFQSKQKVKSLLIKTGCPVIFFVLSPGKRGHIVADTKCFWTKSRTFFVSRTQNLCPQQILRAHANGETFLSAAMCLQQYVLVCQGLKNYWWVWERRLHNWLVFEALWMRDDRLDLRQLFYCVLLLSVRLLLVLILLVLILLVLILLVLVLLSSPRKTVCHFPRE